MKLTALFPRLATILLGLCVSVTNTTIAHADRRAFVVGIDNYANLNKGAQLERAVSDARAIRATLASLGYRVIYGENLTRTAFNQLWQEALNSTKPGDSLVVYFSGHGFEIDSQNYLLPSDAPNIEFGRQERLRREALSLTEILLDIRARKIGVAVAIIDACRNNPLVPAGMRSFGDMTSGLARTEPPEGTFIIYSAGAHETALDRLPNNDINPNSVFTRHLIPLLKDQSLTVQDLALTIRMKVRNLSASVQHSQTPAYYDGLIGRFCVAGCAENTKAGVSDTMLDNRSEDGATGDSKGQWATSVSPSKHTSRALGSTLGPRVELYMASRARLTSKETVEQALKDALRKRGVATVSSDYEDKDYQIRILGSGPFNAPG